MSETIKNPSQETVDEKDPDLFSNWAKRVSEIVEKKWSEMQIGKMEKQLTPREQLEAWDADARRSEELAAFLKSDFWIKRMEPLLRSKSSIPPCPSGDRMTVEEASVEYLRASGRASGYLEVLAEFREWERLGAEGVRRLRVEREKNDEIEKRRLELRVAR